MSGSCSIRGKVAFVVVASIDGFIFSKSFCLGLMKVEALNQKKEFSQLLFNVFKEAVRMPWLETRGWSHAVVNSALIIYPIDLTNMTRLRMDSSMQNLFHFTFLVEYFNISKRTCVHNLARFTEVCLVSVARIVC